MNEVRVRFAPSPTGPMHIGGARTTLFNYIFAKQSHGKFVLRIDDTDLARNDKIFEEDIFFGIKWLGFDWDEQYRQSERMELYKTYAQKLDELGLTYEKEGAVFFRLPVENETIVIPDIIRGDVKFESRDFDDLVIFKSDGMPTYHFANVVDDIDLRITHVIRGEEHLSNTPRHLLIYKALGAPIPKFAHIPLILNADRSKMSKRDGDTALTDFIKSGYLPEAIINFLAQLGWAPARNASGIVDAGGGKDGQDFFTMEELVQKFELSRVQKGGAVFDITRLNFINHHYLAQKPLDEYIELAESFSDVIASEAKQSPERTRAALKLIQDRAQTLAEIPELTKYFFAAPDYEANLLVFKKSSPDQTAKGLEAAAKVLETVAESSWDQSGLQQILEHTLEVEALNPGDIFWPIRVALSGEEGSPSPVELLEALGKAESLKRLKTAIFKLAGN